MRVLWLCNIMLPKIAEYLQKEASNKEGWLSGTFERMCQSGFRTEDGQRLELGVCFPVADAGEELEVCIEGVMAYGFYENMVNPDIYDEALEERLQKIVNKFNPDLIHCFGAEYPHTLAMTKAFPYPEKILVGIQGICGEIAKVYMANLPEKVQKTVTFRDWLRQDSIKQQQEKFAKRGEAERAALQRVGHVTGRTHWDHKCVEEMTNDTGVVYHFMNETLRSNFYDTQWKRENCIPYSIFMSQGDYPLKGLHFMLEAMPEILEKFPETTIWVAGNDLTRNKTFMEKVKLSGYGRYLRRLISKYGLQERVHFLGRLTGKEMKAQYLKSALYVCPSILENSPNSLGEAMLLGMPAIAADTGGIPTVFRDGEDGLMFERGNVNGLAKAVIRMFEDARAAEQYGQQARVHALQTHDPDSNFKRLLEIYSEIIKQ